LHFITESSVANREASSDENDNGIAVALGVLLAITVILLVISLTANVLIMRRKQGRLSMHVYLFCKKS